MRNVMTRVFPLPAPARISTGPSVVLTASRCCGFSSSRNDKREWLPLKSLLEFYIASVERRSSPPVCHDSAGGIQRDFPISMGTNSAQLVLGFQLSSKFQLSHER